MKVPYNTHCLPKQGNPSNVDRNIHFGNDEQSVFIFTFIKLVRPQAQFIFARGLLYCVSLRILGTLTFNGRWKLKTFAFMRLIKYLQPFSLWASLR